MHTSVAGTQSTTGEHASVADTQAMFRRVLGSWAVDLLALRKRGWDRPSLRLVRSATSRRSRRVVRRRAA